MFNRRVVSSCGIPQSMWRSLHIMNRQQATRILPPMLCLPSQATLVPSTGAAVGAAGCAFLAALSSEALSSLASIGVTPLTMMQLVSSNPLLLQMLADTMCCSYIVVEMIAPWKTFA